MPSVKQIAQIKEKANSIRHDIIDMIGGVGGKVGHLGGSLSMADLVAALYFYKMDYDPKDFSKPRDVFLLSKGHAALVQYAALAEAGTFPKEEIYKVKTLGSMLQGHPDHRKTPGVEANTGSLGQGLSVGLGLALGKRLNGDNHTVYVAMGDGEQQEGQLWEAAMAAAAYKTGNLVGIIDRNRVQATGMVADRLDIGNLKAKWQAFGWEVIRIDGHDVEQICSALDMASYIHDQPTVIIADTIKGKGVSFAEGKAAYHNCGLTEEQFKQAHKEIDAAMGGSVNA